MHFQSVVLGDVNVNTRREYSQSDDQQFAQAGKMLRDNRLDLFTADGAKRSLELMDEWFQAHRSVPVSVESIFRAVEERKQEFTWLSPAATNWYKAAEQNPQLANDLANHLAGHGQPGRLANGGDPLFENLLGLFKELHSRRESATPQNIANAQNRIMNRPGPRLQFVAQPRRTEPISPAAKADDGKAFFTDGLKKQRDGSYGKSPADYAAEARAAQEAANPQPTVREQKNADDARWDVMSQELISYGTHGQRETLRKMYESIGDSKVRFQTLDRTVKMFKRSAQMSGWGR